MDTSVVTSLSIILPAYNEAENLEQAVRLAEEAARELVEQFEIIVVDDGSTDGTSGVLNELKTKHPSLRVVTHSPNRGYGVALASGFGAARMEWVLYTDSDNQFDLRQLSRLMELAGEYDFVIGYRENRCEGARRRFFSWGFRVFLRMFFGLRWRDPDCAFKLYRASKLKQIDLRSTRFFIDAEFLAKAAAGGYRVAEVGVTHLPRTKGNTTTGLHHVPITLKEAWRVWRELRSSRRGAVSYTHLRAHET